MEDSSIQLNDLPDEILLIILKKLDNTDVLYSLIGVNKRLDTIARDSIFTRYITLMEQFDLSKKFTDTMLNRFCLEILPRVRHEIAWLNVQSSSMDRILLLTNYPYLSGLGLHDLSSERARDLFTNESYFIRIFKNQLLELAIHINKCDKSESSIKDINIFLYSQIITIFNNLQYLNFNPFGISYYYRLSFGVKPPNIFSSTLLELHVVVDSYEDCLYLLDGRFNQLNIFNATICSSNVPTLPVTNNKKKLPNLKCFVLTHECELLVYNNILIPLLHRMSNLEELDLDFINYNTSIIDGNDLEENIYNYMTKLKKFIFNIRSIISFNNQVNLPTNDNIENTFKNLKKYHIISSVDYFPKAKKFHCLIYSHPFPSKYYNYLTNNFRGGLFECVHEIALFDERPFEHEFFLQIAKSFPVIRELRLNNREPQKNDKQQWPIIEYPYLIRLDLVDAHENYLEQFLNNSKIYLLKNIDFRVDYNSLQTVTDNFTRNATRINCAKIKGLTLFNKPESYPDLKDYFPHAQIC